MTLEVAPASARAAPGGTVGFTGVVAGINDIAITWDVIELGGGTVTEAGLYTAPAGLGTYHVRARSHAAPAVEALAEVIVETPITVGVEVTPSSATVTVGESATFRANVTGTSNSFVTWSVQEGRGCGAVTPGGVYTAPSTVGTCHVVAVSQADPSRRASAEVLVQNGGAACWRLLAVNGVRFVPRSGQAVAMLGGTIQGSNDSATNGFVELGKITSIPAENPAYTELTLSNVTPYRYLKYYSPAGSYGQVAEVEFYSGTSQVTGTGFGTSGSRAGNPWQNALDGDPGTFFDGATASDNYVGIDASLTHLTAAPSFSPPGGTYGSPRSVTITSATAGATITFSTDGADPVNGTRYMGPVLLGPGATTLRAAASSPCAALNGATAVYAISGGGGGSKTTASSLHVGNSLTDSIDGWLQPIAASGGIALDFNRYSVPGIGTWVYQNAPTGGFGVANVQAAVRGRPFDHISFQPFKNMPCVPSGHGGEADAQNRSDAVNVNDAWADAHDQNAAVQLWIFAAWPVAPAGVNGSGGFADNCLIGGWNRDPSIWNPTLPTTWEGAVATHLTYDEAVRSALVALHPTWPPPFIIPAGTAIANLKRQVEAGSIPGLDPAGWWPWIFVDDNHLTSNGRHFVSMVFYAAMFQKSPVGLRYDGTTLTATQALALQAIAWETVSGYPLSGVSR